MEIHAPEGPVHSWRDFAVHIAIVTLGILIAFSLEGLRELVHERHLVAEARENFHRELTMDRDHIDQEVARVTKIHKSLEALIPKLSEFAKQPDALVKELNRNRNPGYFFALDSWQTALSTGALAHMKTDEVLQYAAAEYDIRYYNNLQEQALKAEANARAFFQAHPNPSGEELKQGLERLIFLSESEDGLSFVGAQVQASINAAYRKSAAE